MRVSFSTMVKPVSLNRRPRVLQLKQLTWEWAAEGAALFVQDTGHQGIGIGNKNENNPFMFQYPVYLG